MALEPITRQEKIVAGEDLEPITRMEKFLKEYRGGGGTSVQPDWNQNDESQPDFIKNKPFGEMPTGGDTIEWNFEGAELSEDDLLLGQFYRVSDLTFDWNDISTDGMSMQIAGIQVQITESELRSTWVEIGQPDNIIFGSYFMVVNEDNTDISAMIGEPYIVEKKGVYVIVESPVGSITVLGYTGFPILKKLDERFIPDSVINNTKGFIVLFQDTNNYLYAVDGVDPMIYKSQTELVSNERLTQYGLKQLLISGKPIYLYHHGKDDFIPAIIRVRGDYGYAMGLNYENNTVITIKGYTAEYVPETT